MRKNWQLCDVTLVADDESTFKAHSPVLAAGSDVFYHHFVVLQQQQPWKAGQTFIRVAGIPADALSVTLDFIYGVTPTTRTAFKLLHIGAVKMGIPGAAKFSLKKLAEIDSLCAEGASKDDPLLKVCPLKNSELLQKVIRDQQQVQSTLGLSSGVEADPLLSLPGVDPTAGFANQLFPAVPPADINLPLQDNALSSRVWLPKPVACHSPAGDQRSLPPPLAVCVTQNLTGCEPSLMATSNYPSVTSMSHTDCSSSSSSLTEPPCRFPSEPGKLLPKVAFTLQDKAFITDLTAKFIEEVLSRHLGESPVGVKTNGNSGSASVASSAPNPSSMLVLDVQNLSTSNSPVTDMRQAKLAASSDASRLCENVVCPPASTCYNFKSSSLRSVESLPNFSQADHHSPMVNLGAGNSVSAAEIAPFGVKSFCSDMLQGDCEGPSPWNLKKSLEDSCTRLHQNLHEASASNISPDIPNAPVRRGSVVEECLNAPLRDSTSSTSTEPNHPYELPSEITNDLRSGEMPLDIHHALIPEMTLNDLTRFPECPHLKKLASDSGLEVMDTEAMQENACSAPSDSAAHSAFNESPTTSVLPSVDISNKHIVEDNEKEVPPKKRKTLHLQKLLSNPVAPTAETLHPVLSQSHKTGSLTGLSSEESSTMSMEDISQPSSAALSIVNGSDINSDSVSSSSTTQCVKNRRNTSKSERYSLFIWLQVDVHCVSNLVLVMSGSAVPLCSRLSRGKIHECADCPEKLQNFAQLQTHKLLCHGKGRLFTCGDCEFKSPRKKDVQGRSERLKFCLIGLELSSCPLLFQLTCFPSTKKCHQACMCSNVRSVSTCVWTRIGLGSTWLHIQVLLMADIVLGP